jgi:hypothetical protein
MPQAPKSRSKPQPPVRELPAAAPLEVTDAEIAARAFELYCQRGGEDGHDLEDWLQAERELRQGAAPNVHEN